MKAPQKSDPGVDAGAARTIRVFLCYRRDDGSDAARWLYNLLENHTYRDRDGKACNLDVYFDQMEPGVPNWISHLQPSLESSDAFLVVCSHALATNFSKEGVVDWPHRELEWWLAHRNTAPIVVDLTDNERYTPASIRERWPDINRLLLDGKEFRGSAPGLGTEASEQFRTRIVATIAESERATVHQQLAESTRKNRLLKIVSAVAVVFCIAAVAGWWSARQSQSVAMTQKEVSRRTVQFITALFAGADPQGQFANSLTVAQLLKPVRATLETETSPLLKVNLLRAMGSAYTGLDDPDAALSALQQASDLVKERGIRLEQEDEFRLQQAFGEAYLYTQDKFEDALVHLRRAAELASSPGVDKSEKATAKISFGDFYAWSEPPKRSEAKKYYDDALALDRQAPANWVAVARDYNRLGNLAHDAQQDAEADRYFAQAFDVLGRLPPEAKALYSAQYDHDFATASYNDGKFEDALSRFTASSDAFKSAYGEESVEYGIAQNNIARILLELDKPDDAATYADLSVRVERTAEGPNFSGLAFALNNFALAQRAAGNQAAAEIAFNDASRIANLNKAAIGAQSMVHLAEIALSRDDLKGAKTHLDEAQLTFAKFEVTEGWRYALYESARGELETRQCNLEDADTHLKHGGEVLAERWPKGNLFTRGAEARQVAFDEAKRKQGCKS